MRKYKSPGRLVPVNVNVEHGLSDTETKLSFEILKLFGSGYQKHDKCALTEKERILFYKFYQEQQRLNRLIEIKYLRKYLIEQRTTANKLAAYIKKRDAKEMKEFGSIPLKTSVFMYGEKRKISAPVAKFKVSNDIKDLRAKIHTLDGMLKNLRGMVSGYEAVDYERDERVIEERRKQNEDFHKKFQKLWKRKSD